MSCLKLLRIPVSCNSKSAVTDDPKSYTKLHPPAVLGRGSLLKCGEKKLSRNHATIDWDEEGVLITSTHTNPTYLKIGTEEKTLKQGEAVVLKNGDQFGLLSDSYWFEIVLEGTEECVINETSTEENQERNRLNSEEEKLPKQGSPLANLNSDISLALRDPEAETNDDAGETELTKQNTTVLNSDSNDAKAILASETVSSDLKPKITETVVQAENVYKSDRQRQLPGWLQSLPSTSSKPNECESKKTETKNTQHGKTARRVRKTADEKIPRELKQSPVETMEKINTHKAVPKNSSSKASKSKNQPADREKILHSVSDDSDDSNRKHTDTTAVAVSATNKKPSVKKVANRSTKVSKAKQYHTISQEYDNRPENAIVDAVSDDDDSDQLPNQQKIKTQPASKNDVLGKKQKAVDEPGKGLDDGKNQLVNKSRESCQYGASCYRHNTKHKREYAHPGDQDYEELGDAESNDDDDDRPQCEYGVNCTRKNPQHKKAFKHTRVPQPKRQVARKKRKRSDDESGSDDDDYDYEDPFLNDDSSDDYAPTDSGSDSPLEIDDDAEENDTKRMLKEAKKFGNKKRS